MTITRRLFLGGLLAGIGAPAIVRSGVLMPVRPAVMVPSSGVLMTDGAATACWDVSKWERVPGYERFDGLPVPGHGQIQNIVVHRGNIVAQRSDVLWYMSAENTTWHRP